MLFCCGKMLFYRDELVFARAKSQSCGSLDRVDAVLGLDALEQVVSAGIVGRVDEVETCLVNRDRIQGSQDPDVSHAGIFRHGTAVTVHRHILHDVDVDDISLEIVHDTRCGVRHGFEERIMVCVSEVGRVARAVDIGFSHGGGDAYGELLDRPAVAAHGMPLKV